MELEIAPLARDEVEALCALAREIWRQHYPPIIGAAQTEYMLAQRYDPQVVVAELARRDVWWDTLKEDGDMVAFASSVHGEAPGDLKLDKLYVRPQRQRRGYGAALIGHTCERAARHGYRAVVLAVNKHNTGAITAYGKCGFAIRESIVKEIGSGFVMDDYIMERLLGS
jgi:ribosomal protein S18 acetylase RimI-like enzyme